MEDKTKGHGGNRAGSGRPKKTEEERNVRAYLLKDIALWIKNPETIQNIRQFISAYHN